MLESERKGKNSSEVRHMQSMSHLELQRDLKARIP